MIFTLAMLNIFIHCTILPIFYPVNMQHSMASCKGVFSISVDPDQLWINSIFKKDKSGLSRARVKGDFGRGNNRINMV